MKKILPIIFLFGLSLVFFWQVLLKGYLPIPSDTIVGLYYPFRDLYAKDYPNGIPFKNFLITDPVRQQYPWRQLAIGIEKKFELPLWNPYNFSGYPLLANFQSAPFYPINVLFFILSFPIAWSILIILQPLLAGLFMYLYLRNIKLHVFASLIGAAAFAFSGFFVSWLEWGTIAQTILWVPLILLAKDKLLEKWSTKWMIIFFLAEVAAFFAGHIQTLFYALIVTNIYLFLKICLKAKKENEQENILAQFARIYLPFFLVGVAMYLVTAVQWIPTLQFIFLSARNVDQNPLINLGWFIPWQHLIQFLIPDFFGNPTTLNYFGVWNYAEFAGFIGIVPLLFAFFAAVFRHDKKTWFFLGLCMVSLLFALPTPLGKLPFIFNIPLLSTAQPTRLLALIDFSLAILAALGLDLFLKRRDRKILAVLGFFLVFFAGIWFYVLRFHVGISFAQSLIAKQNLYFPTMILFTTAFLVILLCIFYKKKIVQYVLISLLILITIVDLFRFGWKFTPFTKQAYLFPQTQTLSFLQTHIGDYRFMSTDARIFPPNFSTMYKLQSIEGYDPLYLRSYAEYIAAVERKNTDISNPFGYNRIITPRNYQSFLIDLLGVKYIISLDDIKDPKLKKVFQEGQIQVYENMHVLPRVFFVKKVTVDVSKEKVIEDMFNNKNLLADTAFVLNQTKQNMQTFSIGSVIIQDYQPNRVSILTSNNAKSFLILSDTYYPTWHALIDGKETTIYQADFLFRAIQVPAGKHRVEFIDHLL